MCEVLDIIEDKGYTRGLEQGENRFAELSDFLIENERIEDLRRASKDKDYRRRLLDEFLQKNIEN